MSCCAEHQKINSKNVAYFLRLKKWMSGNHVYQAIHHKRTTFSPRLPARNRENLLQNTTNSTTNLNLRIGASQPSGAGKSELRILKGRVLDLLVEVASLVI